MPVALPNPDGATCATNAVMQLLLACPVMAGAFASYGTIAPEDLGPELSTVLLPLLTIFVKINNTQVCPQKYLVLQTPAWLLLICHMLGLPCFSTH